MPSPITGASDKMSFVQKKKKMQCFLLNPTFSVECFLYSFLYTSLAFL